MNDLIQSSFDYSALPVEISSSLKLRGDRILAVRNRAIYEIGKELYEAQQELAQHRIGCFQAWVKSLDISVQHAYDMMNVYENIGQDIIKNFDNKKIGKSVLYLLAQPSTPDEVKQKAIEKAEAGEKVTVADVKDWKAELETEKQRSQEWKDQWKAERDKASQLQAELALAKSAKPEQVEVVPADYQTAKDRLSTLETELTDLKKEQAKLVNDQVKAKLRERQTELDEMERRKTLMEEQVERMKTYMASLESDIKRAEVHQKVIEEQRLHLISLAAFISDMDPMKDRDTIKRWLALADMHIEAANSIRLVFGETKPRLAAI